MTLSSFLRSDAANKLNAPLRAELQAIDQRDASSDPVTVMGKFAHAPTEEELRAIGNLGIRLDSVMGTIFSATGPALRVAELARWSMVVRMEKPPSMRTKPPKVTP